MVPFHIRQTSSIMYLRDIVYMRSFNTSAKYRTRNRLRTSTYRMKYSRRNKKRIGLAGVHLTITRSQKTKSRQECGVLGWASNSARNHKHFRTIAFVHERSIDLQLTYSRVTTHDVTYTRNPSYCQ